MKRSMTRWCLVAALLFLALGGVFGGLGMLLDRTGGLLGMTDVLAFLPVPSYTLPGIFLLLVMGALPLLLSAGLLCQRRWALTGTMLLMLVLAGWLMLQGLLIGFHWPVQYITALNGLAIVGLALLVRHMFRPGQG